MRVLDAVELRTRDRVARADDREERRAGDRLDRPEGLFVSGGETLRGLADAVDADAFEVTGEIGPGLPAARVCGGRWDGVELVSKSGGFGKPDLLARLLARAGAPLEA